MVKKLHLDLKYLRLKESQEEQLQKYISPDKGLNTIRKCFIRIKDIKQSVDGQYKIVIFDKSEVSLLDLIHTLAYYRCDGIKRDKWYRKWSPVYLNSDHRIGFEVWWNQTEISLKLHQDDLYIIQYGVACNVACNKNINSFVKAPVFPWIIRAFSDKNPAVFRHGAQSLVNLLFSNRPMRINETTARLLPNIMFAIGGNGANKFPWQEMLFDEFFSEKNRMIRSMLAVLVKPNRHHPIYLSEAGYKRMMNCGGIPTEIKMYLNHARKGKDGDYRFNECQNAYYQWYVSEFKENGSHLALDFFLDVYTKTSTKVVLTKKRKKEKLQYIDALKHERCYQAIIQYYANNLHNKYFSIYDRPLDGTRFLTYFLGHVELRHWERMSYDGKKDSPAGHYKTKGRRLTLDPIYEIIKKVRHYEPAVLYPKSKKENIGEARMSFPILKIGKKMHDAIEGIIGEDLHKYFYKQDSFCM